MKRYVFTSGLFFLMISLSLMSTAHADWEEGCWECTDNALSQCEIEQPADKPVCFNDAYTSCATECCNGYCTEQADSECASVDPPEYRACFEESFGWCQEECCNSNCDELHNTCSDSCENQCENEICAGACEDPEGDACQQCMDTCMFGGSEEEGCLAQCDETVSECVQQCQSSSLDSDKDGIPDEEDNCPWIANEDQTDGDSDGIGDACDICPQKSDPDQTDSDSDCIGDACDLCPDIFSNLPMDDVDHDGSGDACDDDIDGDGIINIADNCMFTHNPGQIDSDNDGVGDACDHALLHLSGNNFSKLEPEMKFGVDIALPEHDDILDPISPEEPYLASAYDIFSDSRSHKTLTAGDYIPMNCMDVRNQTRYGWLLGYNSDQDNGTEDAIRFRILIEENAVDRAVIRGLTGLNSFTGEYRDESGRTHGFLGNRNPLSEDGLWSFSMRAIDYPDSSYTSVWDSALIPDMADRTVHVGRYRDQTGFTHGFTFSSYYDGQQYQEEWTGIDVPDADQTYASGINSNGDIVGYYRTGSLLHGFYYHNGNFETVDVLGADSTAPYRINSNGIMAGYYTSQGASHGFLYDTATGKTMTFDIKDARNIYVFGLDDNEQVAGYFIDSSGLHAFMAGPIPMEIPGNDCPGDFDQDGDIDGRDVQVMADNYGNLTCSDPSCGDLTNQGDTEGESQVNQYDLAIFADRFGRACPGILK